MGSCMRRLPPSFLLTLVALPAAVFAQDPELIPASGNLGPGCDFITGDLHFHCVPLYLAYLIKLVFGATGGFFMIQMIRGGFELAFSGFGDRETAKNRIKNAIMGLAVCILSFLIVDTVASALLSGPTT